VAAAANNRFMLVVSLDGFSVTCCLRAAGRKAHLENQFRKATVNKKRYLFITSHSENDRQSECTPSQQRAAAAAPIRSLLLFL